MTRSAGRLATALACFAIGLRWIVNSNPWSGPVVLTLSPTHGVHTNDWLTFVLWAGAVRAALPGWTLLMPLRVRSDRP